MRQIGDDLRVNPFTSHPTVAIKMDAPEFNRAEFIQRWKNQSRTMYVQQSHRFCSKQAGLNFSSEEYTDAEDSRFMTCLNKYAKTFGMFTNSR